MYNSSVFQAGYVKFLDEKKSKAEPNRTEQCPICHKMCAPGTGYTNHLNTHGKISTSKVHFAFEGYK